MTVAYISIGSNVNAAENYTAAVREIARSTLLIGISTVYETNYLRPDGSISNSEFFLNGIVSIDTHLPPVEFKANVLRRIERLLGRTREGGRLAPRTIDLDLVMYGDIVVSERDLVLPSPDIRSRDFVAIPLLELSPNLVLPDSGEPLSKIAPRTINTRMNPQTKLTFAIKKELQI
jgi:2-amino-4-hydroxy-6-hydroxymethyldihydropteridine diphosphokinase